MVFNDHIEPKEKTQQHQKHRALLVPVPDGGRSCHIHSRPLDGTQNPPKHVTPATVSFNVTPPAFWHSLPSPPAGPLQLFAFFRGSVGPTKVPPPEGLKISKEVT